MLFYFLRSVFFVSISSENFAEEEEEERIHPSMILMMKIYFKSTLINVHQDHRTNDFSLENIARI